MPKPWMSNLCWYCWHKSSRPAKPSGPNKCIIQLLGGQYRLSPPMYSVLHLPRSVTQLCESTAKPKSISQKVARLSKLHKPPAASTSASVWMSFATLIKMLCELISRCQAIGASMSSIGATSQINFAAKEHARRRAICRFQDFGSGRLTKRSKDSPGTTVIAVRTFQPPSFMQGSTLYATHVGTRNEARAEDEVALTAQTSSALDSAMLPGVTEPSKAKST
mmetsp:Transcript_11721/g.31403  ORF Transcript_11721/g.31403 Transcript_11721/m.31403 type:complete len:221 (-) Transcript_11721:279-941(-)